MSILITYLGYSIGFLSEVLSLKNLKIEDVVSAAEEKLEQIEGESFDNTAQMQLQLTTLHRRLLRLNRFIRPQLAALEKLTTEIADLNHVIRVRLLKNPNMLDG